MNPESSNRERDSNSKIFNGGSFLLNESRDHETRPSMLTSSILIKDITYKIKVWDVEDIWKLAKLPACYAFYDKYGTLLYVGKAKDIWIRFSAHMHSSNTNTTSIEVMGKKYYLWRNFHSIRLFKLSQEDAPYLEYLEQCLFHVLRPKHNLWKLGMITGEEYKNVLEKSPSHDQSVGNGWEENEKDNLKDAKINWPDKQLLIDDGIIKKGEKYVF